MNHHLITAALLAALCAPAWAVNKCTGPDGKVAFQDAPCGNASKAAEQVKTWENRGRPSGDSWVFSRRKDDMTGAITCFAVSPAAFVGTPRKYIDAHLQVALAGDLRLLTVRLSPSGSDLFHNNLGGMGIKIDDNAFAAITRKIGQHAVGFTPADESQLLDQMQTARQVKMRVRFWPWDSLHDSAALSLQGFRQAFALAQECAVCAAGRCGG